MQSSATHPFKFKKFIRAIAFLCCTTTLMSTSYAASLPPSENYEPIEFLTRQGHQMGLYVVRSAYNIQNTPTVSAMPFLDTMAPDNNNKMAPLNKWQEIDWEFVPFTPKQGKPTATVCKGVGLFTTCEHFSGLQDFHTLYTNTEIAQLAKQQGILPSDMDATWDNFVKVFAQKKQWPGFRGIDQGQPGFIPPENRQDPAGHFITTNVIAIPHGDVAVTANIDDTTYHSTVLAPGHSGSTDGHWAIGAVGEQMSAEDYLYDENYNAHNWHYYTIAITPAGLAWYIDAPQKGFDITHAKPIRFLPATDYPYNPDTFFNDEFAKAKQFVFGQQQSVGSFQTVFQIWSDKDWGGEPIPGMSSDSYVSSIGFADYDASKSTAGHPAFKAPVMIDFSDTTQITPENWMHTFSKNFDIDVFNYGLNLSTYKDTAGIELQALKISLHTADNLSYDQALSATTGAYSVTGPGIPSEGLTLHILPPDHSESYDLHIYPNDRTRSMLFNYGTRIQLLGGEITCIKPDARSHGHGTWVQTQAPNHPYQFVQGLQPDGTDAIDGQITLIRVTN